MNGERRIARMRLQSSASSAIAASIAAPKTMSEVSMRQPCQVTTTSPGRSASQATPSDSAPTTIEEIDDADHCVWARLAERRQRIGGDAPARRNGRVARLGFLDPRFGQRFLPLRGKRAISASAAAMSTTRGVGIDPRDDRRRVVARRRIDRGDAHELLRVALQPPEEGAVARRGAGGSQQGRRELRKLVRKFCRARYAVGGEWFERRQSRSGPRRAISPPQVRLDMARRVRPRRAAPRRRRSSAPRGRPRSPHGAPHHRRAL